MSVREGCIWREIPAAPGEKPRWVYLINGKARAFAGGLEIRGDPASEFNAGILLTKPFYYKLVGGGTFMAATLEDAKCKAEEEVWR